VEFCVVDGCHEIAITAARSDTHCRGHYRSVVLADVALVRARVLIEAPAAIVDARTGQDIERGGVVELDPAETHIPALVYQGAIAILPPAHDEQDQE